MASWCKKDENHPYPTEPGFYDVIVEIEGEPIRNEGIGYWNGKEWKDIHVMNSVARTIDCLGIPFMEKKVVDWKTHRSYFDENPSDLITERVRAAWESVIGGNIQISKDDPNELYDDDIRLQMLSEIKRATSITTDHVMSGTVDPINILKFAQAFAEVWKCRTDV